MFCCALLYVHSSLAIILMGKRELVALLNLSSWCLVVVGRLFLAVPRGCLQFVIVVFPDHTHLQFYSLYLKCNNIDLKLTKGNKILGANIDENLVRDSRHKYIVKKVSTHLWLLSQISSYLSVKDRLLFYNEYVRPHFDNCSVIWGSFTCSSTNKIT